MVDFFLNLFRFFIFFLVDIVYKVLFRSSAVGPENIPKDGGVMIASNHKSAWDVFLIPYFAVSRFSSRRISLAAKEELFRFFPVGIALRMMRVIPVKRRTVNSKQMSRLNEILKKHILIVFPEGTRTKTGRLGKGSSGVGKMIWECRPTVIPTAVINTNYCSPGGSWFSLNFFQKLYVVYGEPIDMEKYYAMEGDRKTFRMITGCVMDEIAKLIEKHKELDTAPAKIFQKVNAGYKNRLRELEEKGKSL